MTNKKQSSPELARKAARILIRVRSSEIEKSLAGSVLSQASGKPQKVRLRLSK